MLEMVIEKIEMANESLTWHGALGAGVAFTFAGLVIWLAGLSMARIASAAVGGFAGCIAFYILLTQKTELVAFGVIAGVLAGLFVEVMISYIIGYANFAYNIVVALLTAASGAILIFLGMIFLLTIKGAQPLEHINARQHFYLTVLFAMIVFGTLEQIIFCKKRTSALLAKKRKSPELEVEASEKNSWRNR